MFGAASKETLASSRSWRGRGWALITGIIHVSNAGSCPCASGTHCRGVSERHRGRAPHSRTTRHPSAASGERTRRSVRRAADVLEAKLATRPHSRILDHAIGTGQVGQQRRRDWGDGRWNDWPTAVYLRYRKERKRRFDEWNFAKRRDTGSCRRTTDHGWNAT